MKYTGSLRSKKMSIRITEENFEYISSLPGDKLSEKIDYLICRSKLESDQPLSATEEIDRLQKVTNELFSRLREAHAPGSQFKSEEFLIKTMLVQNGYDSDQEVIARIMLLNALTEKNHTLQEICRLWKEKTAVSEEADKLVEKIAKQLAQQEIRKKPVYENEY